MRPPTMPCRVLVFVALSFAAQASAQLKFGDRWRSISPLPTGETIESVVITPSRAVAAAGGTTVLSSNTSSHGASWTTKRLNPSVNITEQSFVAYAGTTLLMGSGTSFYTSTDSGVTWTAVTTDLPSFGRIKSLTGASGWFMAILETVASTTTYEVVISTNGVNWTSLGQPSTPDSNLTYYPSQLTVNPGGRYVVVGAAYDGSLSEYSSVTWSTTDGTSWDVDAFSSGDGLDDVLWTGSKFVAVGGSHAVYSTDGLSWSEGTGLVRANCVATNGTILLAAGSTAVATSSDGGQTWTAQTTPAAPFDPKDLAHDGTAWIAVGANGVIHTSTNGTNWLRRAPGGAIVDFLAVAHNGLSGGNSRYMAMGSDERAWVSNNGANWTQISFISFPGAENVMWDGTQFFIVSDFFSSISTDGSSWTSSGQFGANSQDSDVMTKCVLAGGKFVAIGYNYDTSEPRIYSGTAYDSFVKRTVPVGSGVPRALCHTGSLWIVVGDDGTILTSPDGNTWTKRTTNAPGVAFTSVASTGSVHVAYAQGVYTCFTSTNGTAWTQQSSVPGDFNSMLGVDGRIVGITEGTAHATTNGVDWSFINLPSSAEFKSMTFTGTQLLAVGTNISMMISDLVPEGNFAVAAQSVFESSGTATVVVTLTTPSASALTLPVSVAGSSTAVLNTDYSTLPTSVTFAAGEQTALFEVPLLNDSALDGNKTLILNLGTTTGMRAGTLTQMTLTLADDDSPPTVALLSTKRTVSEHTGSVLLEAELSWPAPGPVTINLTQTGTAVTGSDFNAPTSLTFNTGERTKTATISVVEDTVFENDETATFTISSPTGATAAATNQSFDLTILDDDGPSTVGRRWTLRQQLPTADGVFGLAAIGSNVVGVGAAGTTVFSSDGGNTWGRFETGISNSITLTAITADSSRFYACADGGHILTSDNGITWKVRTVPDATSDFYFGGIASNGTRTVVVGDVFDTSAFEMVPLIYTTTDGQQWTREVLPFGVSSVFDVAWNGSIFVAVGNKPVGQDYVTCILTSTDGRTWTNRSSALTNVALYDVSAAGASFVAFDHTKNCYTSPDGITWTARSVGTGTIVDGAWNGSKFVGVGGSITSSTNLTAFTQAASPSALRLNVCLFVNGQFIAAGGSGSIYTSPDGTAWTRRGGGMETFADFNAVTWANNQFVAVGSNAYTAEQTLIGTSADGTTWTRVNNKLNKNLYGVAWSGTQLVAVGDSGTIATSTNGTVWTTKKSGTTLNLKSVIWARNTFMAVGGNLTGEGGTTGPGGAAVLTSPDGNTWTRRTVPTNQPLTSVTYTGSAFVAVGRATVDNDPGGTQAVILTSADGIQWIRQGSNVTVDLTAVAANGNNVMATTANYRIIRSSNGGFAWSTVSGLPQAAESGDALFSVLWSGSAFHVGGDSGQTLYSTNGTDWSASRSETTSAIRAFAWNSQTLAAVGTFGSVQTSGPGSPLSTTPQLAFATGSMTVPESVGVANITLQLSSPATTKITALITPDTGTSTLALSGAQADLTLPKSAIVFNPGEVTKVVSVPVKIDTRVESPESVTLSLTGLTGGATVGAVGTLALTVSDDDSLPIVNVSSASQLLAAGSSLALAGNVFSFAPVTIQWKKNNVPVGASVIGSKSSRMLIPSLAISDGGTYTLSATNASGTSESSPIKVGVYQPQNGFPPNYTVGPNGVGTYSPIQNASSNCVLHWEKNNVDITTSLPTGVTLTPNRSTLKITNVPANAGTYTCRVELPGVTIAPHVLGSTFVVSQSSVPLAITPISTLPPATVGTAYSYPLALLVTGTADRWTASGLPKGLRMINGFIVGYPEKATTSPVKVMITASNAFSSSTVTPTITVSPIPPELLGTHVGLLPRAGLLNDLGGIITLTVTSNGYLTCAFNLGAEKRSFVGRVSSTGSGLWTVAGADGSPVPSAVIAGRACALQFNFDPMSNPSGTGTLYVNSGTQVDLSFTTRQVLTGSTLAGFAGRYHYALRLGDNGDVGDDEIPQGHGFGAATVSATGAISHVGKTADGEVISASSFILSNGSSALFASLYKGNGSLMAEPLITLAGTGNQDSTIIDMANAIWSKSLDSTVGARAYPDGWSPVDLNLEGSRYLVPAANAVVMGLTYTVGNYNATCDLNLDVLSDEPQIALMNVGVQPKGPLVPPFPDSATLRLSIAPATGLFTGTADVSSQLRNYVLIPRKGAKIEAQVVRIIGASPEQAAYGYIVVPALPDVTISPTPAANTTSIRTLPVTIKPIGP